MEKTKIRVIGDVHQSRLKKDDIGYIDGYVRGGDDRPYAVVVKDNIIDLAPIYMLEVFSE